MTAGTISTASTTRGAAAHQRPSVNQAVRFTGPIDRVRIGMGYRLGMLLAAGVMVVLPVLYVGVIVGFGWLIWLHLTHDGGMVTVASGRAGLFLVLLYVA